MSDPPIGNAWFLSAASIGFLIKAGSFWVMARLVAGENRISGFPPTEVARSLVRLFTSLVVISTVLAIHFSIQAVAAHGWYTSPAMVRMAVLSALLLAILFVYHSARWVVRAVRTESRSIPVEQQVETGREEGFAEGVASKNELDAVAIEATRADAHAAGRVAERLEANTEERAAEAQTPAGDEEPTE